MSAEEAAERRAERIRALVAAAPPLTEGQVRRLARTIAGKQTGGES